MAIEDIVGVALNALVELVSAAVFKDKKPTKKQSIIAWAVVFILVILLLWFTLANS